MHRISKMLLIALSVLLSFRIGQALAAEVLTIQQAGTDTYLMLFAGVGLMAFIVYKRK